MELIKFTKDKEDLNKINKPIHIERNPFGEGSYKDKMKEQLERTHNNNTDYWICSFCSCNNKSDLSVCILCGSVSVGILNTLTGSTSLKEEKDIKSIIDNENDNNNNNNNDSDIKDLQEACTNWKNAYRDGLHPPWFWKTIEEQNNSSSKNKTLFAFTDFFFF